MTHEEAERLRLEGNAAFSAGQLERAVSYYDRTVELDPANHAALSNRSLCNLKLGRCEDSLRDATRCVDANPSWPKGHARRAAALQALGRTAEAQAAAEEAVRLDSGATREFTKLLESLRRDQGVGAKRSGAEEARGSDQPEVARDLPLALPGDLSATPQRGWFPGALSQFSFHACARGPAPNLLVLLHGLGDSDSNFLAFGRRLDLPATHARKLNQMQVLALRAPHALPLGLGHAWFPAFEPDGAPLSPASPDPRRARGLARAAELVREALGNCWRRALGSPRGTFLLGFSDGALVALQVGLSLDLGGALALSGTLHLDDLCAPRAAEAPLARPTPLLLSHGSRDDRAPLPEARRACQGIRALATPARQVVWKEYDKGHEMPRSRDEARDLHEFFAQHLLPATSPPGSQELSGSGVTPMAARDDMVEVTDPEIIRKVLAGQGLA